MLDQHDPRRLKNGARKRAEISETDLDLTANYLAHRYAKGSARVELAYSQASATASLPIPLVPISLDLNATAVIGDARGQPQLKNLRIGRLAVPSWAVPWPFRAVAKFAADNRDLPAVGELVKELRITPKKLTVVYQWQENLPHRLRAGLLTYDDQARIKTYHDLMVAVAKTIPGGSVSLTAILAPLFALAQERSQEQDPIKENRAAILVLTLYVTGEKPSTLIVGAKAWAEPVRREITLNQRDDFAKHFMVSAAFAAHAGSPLADAVGLYKEIADSRGGSGFSFNDIAADRAGTKFGAALVSGKTGAKKLQQQVAQRPSEAAIIPATHDLPEFMQEAEFKRRYGGVGAPAYDAMVARIERRVAALSFYR